MKPYRLLDLFCGRWGWSRAFAARGWQCVGVDLTAPPEIPEGCEFLPLDVLTLTAQFIRDGQFDFICASSPCEQFSVHGMKHFHPNPSYPALGLQLFNHTRAICEASGVPYVMENVRAAQQFVGNAVHHCGPFYLWGNAVPPLMNQGISKAKWYVRPGHPGNTCKESLMKKSARKPILATIPPELANTVADYAERIIAPPDGAGAGNSSNVSETKRSLPGLPGSQNPSDGDVLTHARTLRFCHLSAPRAVSPSHQPVCDNSSVGYRQVRPLYCQPRVGRAGGANGFESRLLSLISPVCSGGFHPQPGIKGTPASYRRPQRAWNRPLQFTLPRRCCMNSLPNAVWAWRHTLPQKDTDAIMKIDTGLLVAVARRSSGSNHKLCSKAQIYANECETKGPEHEQEARRLHAEITHDLYLLAQGFDETFHPPCIQLVTERN